MQQVIARHQALPFAWGTSDCTMFAHVVEAMTGFNVIADARPYSSALGALISLRARGHNSTLELVASNFNEISPSRAGRGDLGFTADADPLTCPAIIDGAMAHSKNERGPVVISRAHIVRAFAV
jgi:hypothetical protein